MRIPSILKPDRKKIIILIGIVLIVSLAFIFFNQKKTTSLQFAQVKKGEIKQIVSSSGILTGKEVADLKFKSAGKMTYLSVKEGDTVQAYTLVASLDVKQLEIDLQQARNTLVAKDAAAKKAEDDVKNHDKDESFTQKETRTAAQVARDNAYDEVKSAQEALIDAYLYTPIAGLVTKTPFVAGQNVNTTDIIAQIVDISQIYFDTEVDETDISKVSQGQQAEIILDAYSNKVFTGTVDLIIPRTQETSSGADIVIVRIKLKDMPANFVQGLSGQSEIVVNKSSDVLYIPIEALGDDNKVVVKEGENFKEIKVSVGVQSDSDVEIKEGLSENQIILLNPPLNLKGLQKKSIFQRPFFK